MSEKFIDREYLLDSFKDYNTDIVEKKFDQVNSNLDTLEFGEVAGGKNLIDYSKCKFGYWIQDNTGIIKPKSDCYVTEIIPIEPNTTYTISGTSSSFRVEFDESLNSLMEKYYIDTTFTTKPTARYIRFNSYIENTDDGTLYNHPQLEKGNVKTPYEPYIPSVKMLAEEVSAQNESLSVIGKCKNLLNPTLQTTTQNGVTCTNNGDGTYTLNGTATSQANFGLTNVMLNKHKKMKMVNFSLLFQKLN